MCMVLAVILHLGNISFRINEHDKAAIDNTESMNISKINMHIFTKSSYITGWAGRGLNYQGCAFSIPLPQR